MHNETWLLLWLQILHYWTKEFFAPIHVVANIDILGKLHIFVVRDTLGDDQSLELHMRIIQWSSLQSAFDQYWNLTVVSIIDSLGEWIVNRIEIIYGSRYTFHAIAWKHCCVGTSAAYQRLLDRAYWKIE